MGNALLPWVRYHTRGSFSRDGVYMDPTSRFPQLSLFFTEPVVHASVFGLASVAAVLLRPLFCGDAPPLPPWPAAAAAQAAQAEGGVLSCLFALFSLAPRFAVEYAPSYLLTCVAPLHRAYLFGRSLVLPPRFLLCPFFSCAVYLAFLALTLYFWYALLRRLASGFRLPAALRDVRGSCASAAPLAREAPAAASAAFPSVRAFAAAFSARAVVDSAFKMRASAAARGGRFLPLRNRRVVVTGGAGGIGRETARQLALWGAHVLIGCRSSVDEGRRVAEEIELEVAAAAARGEGAHPGKVSVAHLDLCAFPSVRAFAAFALHLLDGHVDLLINNAGVMMLPHLTIADSCGFEKQFTTNHLGHFLLTLLLLPALRRAAQQAPAPPPRPAETAEAQAAEAAAAAEASALDSRCLGRVINVASCAQVWHAPGFRALDAACTPEALAAAGVALAKPLEALQGLTPVSPVGYDRLKAYGNSKLANIWFTKELQRRLIAEARAAAQTPEEGTAAGGGAKADAGAAAAEASREASESIAYEPLPPGTVGVYAVHPGSVRTSLMRHVVADSKLKALFFDTFLAHTVMKSPRDGAATQLLLCIADREHLLPGAYYADGGPSWVVPAANDDERMRELWAVSEVVCFGGLGSQTYVK
ncbi:oxidoreductase, short chain dehydrogenase/reductase family protein [Besnoitia besnoiti]|uniref:Oxidoreductase, short chain dehydrogenase/reductase family protein n=1 Tax=Besnoitia besnoiti TaxID=94643 RepID=A0A2A9ME06_BESBE|nr:oxidoreductase, short chain dehydrogenase/reductase family protein [Besnoitia besnoiti]PFH33903.1 oxidoreductase, short chain dehydrogenase/reductase family protein [Besnoitia besnoiti]